MMDFSVANKILLTCARGVVPFLQKEVERLGFPVQQSLQLGLFTRGTLNDAIALNLSLRTANRVHFLLHEFRAENPDHLYQQLVKLPWEGIIDSRGYVSVTSSVMNDAVSDSRFANLKCKDAIVDRIAAKKGERPDSGPDHSRSAVYLYWKENDCAIYVDTTGESLSRRGYRKIPLQAPMQETLAAAVLLAADWRGDGHFVNPMCGSGTLGIEAALIALNKAPGLLRHNFGFMHVKGYDKAAYLDIRKSLRADIRKKSDFDFVLSDIDGQAVAAARQNARTAGVDHLLKFHRCDFRETPVPQGRGMVFVNPGYGVRLEDERSLEGVYSGLGDFFKRKCLGYTGYIFTGNLMLAKRVGLKTSRRLIFYNGSIEARLLEYELYDGSRAKPHTVVQKDGAE
ncbi:class I SAM-dependent RNA methyltransferase [candidate division KSB1 bacterium]|nr:class I SAM-dependent RNA methyltransferase [candidate division KSB1 bacterium]